MTGGLKRVVTFAVLQTIGIASGIAANYGAIPGLEGDTDGRRKMPIVALDPVDTIVEALQGHSIVNIGESPHASETMGRFWLQLLRDGRVMAAVDDVAVEFGNSLHQSMADRFVLGDDVPYGDLRKIWEDANTNGTFDHWMYEETLWAVRAWNKLHPKRRPVRVLLLGLPFDWARIESSGDMEKQHSDTVAPGKGRGGESRWVANRIKTEVTDRNRRAVVLQGFWHARKRKPEAGDDDGWSGSTELAILSQELGVAVFSVVPIYNVNLESSGIEGRVLIPPFLVKVHGTRWGAMPFHHLSIGYPDGYGYAWFDDVGLVPGATEAVVDAVIYLEPVSRIVYASPSRMLCMDAPYLDMRVRRLRATGNDGDAWARRFRERCERTFNDDPVM